jgi:hypothetical protein
MKLWILILASLTEKKNGVSSHGCHCNWKLVGLTILKPWANWETLLRKHCFLPMFRHVSQSGQTLGNISEKHRETSNVSEVGRKHFCFSGSKFCFRNNVSTGGQTGKHLWKHQHGFLSVTGNINIHQHGFLSDLRVDK